MKNFSNTYIYTFSSVMVIVVALLLALAALQLKPFQDKNIEIEKKQNILASINIVATTENAESLYEKYITENFVVNVNGELIEKDAFSVDVRAELSKSNKLDRLLPVYVTTLEDGKKAYVVPLRGKGLWGPIWGYISFEKDLNTIYGANFDHQGETPGLGAEIKETFFQKPFIGKQIFKDSSEFVSIKVNKGGVDPKDLHAVDAISGGTITSKGLEAMIDSSLIQYKTYFLTNRK
ncbi:MAG: NADH:ubiquinone reductase (Na(+)-transporting) subunit C [Salinivirgaceae bacterium]|nr:NADH:ubiquinone reductase (Na(+)-transporting) subunit C [Salinivirgaceae bacterium]